MKQLIVLLATVNLGLAIAGMVIGLKTPSKTITDTMVSKMQTTLTGSAISVD